MPGAAAPCSTPRGLSVDRGDSGVRIPYGEGRIPPVTCWPWRPTTALSLRDQRILTLDPTIRQNPQALLQLCKGALAIGMREFSANVADSDLVRVTGYMIRKRDVACFAAEGSEMRLQTTCLGAEAKRADRDPPADATSGRQ